MITVEEDTYMTITIQEGQVATIEPQGKAAPPTSGGSLLALPEQTVSYLTFDLGKNSQNAKAVSAWIAEFKLLYTRW